MRNLNNGFSFKYQIKFLNEKLQKFAKINFRQIDFFLCLTIPGNPWKSLESLDLRINREINTK